MVCLNELYMKGRSHSHILSVLDLPQLYTKPSSGALLEALTLLEIGPPSWDAGRDEKPDHVAQASVSKHPGVIVNPEGVTRYLTSIVSSGLGWIDDDDAKEAIWSSASQRLSERSGRTAMGAISRKFRIPVPSGSFDLSIHEPTLTGDDLGLKTWAASYLLAKRLHSFDLVPKIPSKRLHVLELGSGTGLVGLAMAGLGADVVLTDLPNICPNLARNAEVNGAAISRQGGSTRTATLDWTHPTTCTPYPAKRLDSDEEVTIAKFPLILAADSLYSPDHPHMLVETINAWLSSEDNAKVIVEFPYRNAYLPEIKDFRQRMTASGLHIVQEGEESGYDDWGSRGGDQDDDERALVTCWWSCWGRQNSVGS